MENDGNAGDDDQGSGWFEVKKRHRTSSKFSIQNVTGVFSNKAESSFPCNQASGVEKVVKSNSRWPPLPPKGGREFSNNVKVDVESTSSSAKTVQGMHCLEKLVDKQETEKPKPPFCGSANIPGAEGGTRTVEVVPKMDNLVKVPKIKWGDFEDDVLVPHGCHEKLDGVSEVKSNDIGSDHLADGNLKNADDLVSHVPPSEHQEEKECLVSEDVVPFSSSVQESVEGNWQVVNEISSEDLGLPEEDGKTDTLNDAVRKLGMTHHEPRCIEARDAPSSGIPAIEISPPPAIEGDGIMTDGQGLSDKSEDGALDISEVPVIGQVSTMGRVLQDFVSLSYQESDPVASCNASVTSTVGDWRVLQDGIVEGELGESKERFRQRLWCFLFENLNRAVDELYLLCELECDVEQMKEAILVLEEAASDFKELKSRVEGFEFVKRSPSQPSKDGISANVKNDHRRPHALSWEVRRMASSPHRAEILSSSLEAFKKIQQERASKHAAHEAQGLGHVLTDLPGKAPVRSDVTPNARETGSKTRKQNVISDLGTGNTNVEKRNVETSRLSKAVVNSRLPPQSSSVSDCNISQVSSKNSPATAAGKGKKEPLGSIPEMERQMAKKDKVLTESKAEKCPKSLDPLKRHSSLVEKEKEREKRSTTFKSMDAWKEKRNWEDILAAPLRNSSRVSHSPGMSRKSMERARVLHDKLMSPEKKKKTALDMKREAEEKHARAMRIRSELENERVQRLQRTSEKLNRVNEWQAVRSLKLREGMFARHQRSESRHEAYLAQVVRRAGDESSKVNEVRFITSLNEENKKLMLRQKLQDSELRRAEKLQVIRTKQKEDMAREEAVLERRKLLEAEKLQRLAETQRKKEEAQVRREEERKASSAAREAKAVEQLRRKEVRAKAQQEEAELLAQKLAERLSESEQRRKFYLEQIREKASMDFRDQSSPLVRRFSNKEGQGRSVSTNSVEDYQASLSGLGGSTLGIANAALQHSLKRRIKKIRQRLMALKYEFTEPPVGAENVGIGYRAQVGTARAKIGRWLQDLQRLRQARKEGAASIGLIVGDMIKFLEGKDSELHASRQAGLLDFIASALPASHTSKPEACQVTIYLLRLLRVVLSVPANRSYFLAQNLLPPIIPMLSAALENYIKIAATLNVPGSSNSVSIKTSVENLESVAEVLDGFLWTVTTIIGHICSDERQLQMRDGLMELVIAYQVIHRLRDLFALYDRPQVEGSPFPSSILLSLNMLAVLTSRSGSISSIDWELYLSKTTSEHKIQEAKLAECAESDDVGDSLVVNATFGNHKLPSSLHVMAGLPINGGEKSSSNGKPLSDVPEDRPLHEPYRTSIHGEPLSGAKDPGKELTDISVELDNFGAGSQECTKGISGESRRRPMEEHAKPSLSQKDEKITTVNIAEQNNHLSQNDDPAAAVKNGNGQGVSLKQSIAFLVSAIAETGLVSLPSLLTAVLLQANNRLSSEQGSYVLPSNFEEVATGVLKVLNNLAMLDITLLQSMLARPDLQMEFFHLMSFLLSHCTSKWKVATDQNHSMQFSRHTCVRSGNCPRLACFCLNHYCFLATLLCSTLEIKKSFDGARAQQSFTRSAICRLCSSVILS
ncbi:uncharacterized protein LOC131219231 isoform X2 [Magnolia sinica]|uniref:uncharacterized protein LOC131219231 isoform X2 n=1 Tax=Magnolia sinica TaxID=86752 RepID=UPI002657ED54|nr:uncharacterized protein LOC131219231 isoform X2 [Magnolia sinica]